MIALMTMPKMDKALRLLVTLERAPMSSFQLASTTGYGRATVVRLVADLRGLGCDIEAVRAEGGEFSYRLNDWGIFDRTRVLRYLKGSK